MTPFEKKEAARQANLQERADRAATKARDKVLAKAKAKTPPMSPSRYRDHLKKLAIPVSVAGNYFGMSPRQAQRIAAEGPVPRLVAKVIKLIEIGKIGKEDLL